jgi:hypothetical protein
MRARAACNDAFLICHEIYRAARELVGLRVATTQLLSSSKFLWRPDLRPRLVEYVADFARAGERALGAGRTGSGGEIAAPGRAPSAGGTFGNEIRGRADRYRPRAPQLPRASRLILFRMYYLGGAEYHAARRVLGISERTWSDWAEEIRRRVGDELIRAGMYPPGRYFKQASSAPAAPASTNDTAAAKKLGLNPSC